MIKITFLKKDELALLIYKTIWENRNLWYVPKLKILGGHFCGVHEKKKNTYAFIYEGELYVDTSEILINIPDKRPVFTERELKDTIRIEKVNFSRKKGEGYFLTDENVEKRFGLIGG